MPDGVAAHSPMSTNPAWLIDEYASIRFTLRWTRASDAPTSIVSAARAQTIGRQPSCWVNSAEASTRSTAANAPTFTTAAM